MAEKKPRYIDTEHILGEDGDSDEHGTTMRDKTHSAIKGVVKVSDKIEGVTIEKVTGALGGVPGAIRRRTKTLVFLALTGAAAYGALQYHARGQETEAKEQKKLEDEENNRELQKKKELNEKPNGEISIVVKAKVVNGKIVLSPAAGAIIDQCGTPHKFTIKQEGGLNDTEEDGEKMLEKGNVVIQFKKPHGQEKSYKYQLVKDLYADQNSRSLRLKARLVPVP